MAPHQLFYYPRVFIRTFSSSHRCSGLEWKTWGWRKRHQPAEVLCLSFFTELAGIFGKAVNQLKGQMRIVVSLWFGLFSPLWLLGVFWHFKCDISNCPSLLFNAEVSSDPVSLAAVCQSAQTLLNTAELCREMQLKTQQAEIPQAAFQRWWRRNIWNVSFKFSHWQ